MPKEHGGICPIGSQRGGVPTQVRAGRPDCEGGVGGAGPSRMIMRSSLGVHGLITILHSIVNTIGRP